MMYKGFVSLYLPDILDGDRDGGRGHDARPGRQAVGGGGGHGRACARGGGAGHQLRQPGLAHPAGEEAVHAGTTFS